MGHNPLDRVIHFLSAELFLPISRFTHLQLPHLYSIVIIHYIYCLYVLLRCETHPSMRFPKYALLAMLAASGRFTRDARVKVVLIVLFCTLHLSSIRRERLLRMLASSGVIMASIYTAMLEQPVILHRFSKLVRSLSSRTRCALKVARAASLLDQYNTPAFLVHTAFSDTHFQ